MAYHPGDEQECRMSSHAQAKGTTRAVAVARASTGLTTHPAGARVRAWCQGSRDPSAGRDREARVRTPTSADPAGGDASSATGRAAVMRCFEPQRPNPTTTRADTRGTTTTYSRFAMTSRSVTTRNLSPRRTRTSSPTPGCMTNPASRSSLNSR